MIVNDYQDEINVLSDPNNQITIKKLDDENESICVQTPENAISTRLGIENTTKVVSSISVDNLVSNFNQLDDIDILNPQDGDILIYNLNSNVWENTNEIDGGEY
jgi:hypothetical protein